MEDAKLRTKSTESKSEVAKSFGRNSCAFWRMVHRDEELMAILSETKYRARQHTITQRQKRIIADYYGYDNTIN